MSPKSRSLLIILFFCALATFAFTTLGRLDGLIPGDQKIFLAPSGYVVALPKTGGKPTESAMQGAVKVVASGWQAIGPLRVLDGSQKQIGFPAKSSVGSVALVLRPWVDGKSVGPGQSELTLPADAREFAWAGDTMVYLSQGAVSWIAPLSNPVGRGASGSAFDGVAVQDGNDLHTILAWSNTNLSVTEGVRGQSWTQVHSATSVISSAGFYRDAGATKWVLLDATGNVVFEGGPTVKTPVQGQLRPDNRPNSVLLWSPPTGDIWRVGAHTSVRIAQGVSDVLATAGGGKPDQILLGGVLGAGSSTLGDGIRHLGAFHQPGGLGIGTLRVDPEVSSPGRVLVNITAGILAPGKAAWTAWIRTPSGDSLHLRSGDVLPAGILSMSWNSTNRSSGKYWAVIEASRDDERTRDSVPFRLDATAPTDLGVWQANSEFVSTTAPWIADLRKAVDDGDTDRAVSLVVRLKGADGRVRRVEVSSKELPAKTWTFDARLPDGSLLPEGDYEAVWVLVDAAGNATDSSSVFGNVSSGRIRVRWSGPQVQAHFSPIQVPFGSAGSTKLQIAVAGSPNANATVRVCREAMCTWEALSPVVLDSRGRADIFKDMNVPADLPQGVARWTVEVSEEGRPTETHALLFVGQAKPTVTWPTRGLQLISRGGALVVRGIAPDPDPTAEGAAIYRVSVHASSAQIPAVTTWNTIEGVPGIRLIPVVDGKQALSGAITSFDTKGVDGTVGQASRLASEEDLAVLDPTFLRDSTVLLTLWVGKGSVVNTDTVRVRVGRGVDSARSLSLKLIRPASPLLDRTNADLLDDTLSWDVVDGANLDLSASIWSSGADPRRVWWTNLSGPHVTFTGFDPTGMPLPTGAYTLRVTGRSGNDLWTKDASLEIRTPAQAASEASLELRPRLIPLGTSRLTGIPIHPRFAVVLSVEDSVRLVVADVHGTALSVVGPMRARVLDTLWSGVDDSGQDWMDPVSGPATQARETRLLVSLQRADHGSWTVLDLDTLELQNTPTRFAPNSVGLFAQGHDERLGAETLRVADLQSDVKLRGRLDGKLLYFPPRPVRFEVRPQGWQVARQWKPVDYQIEWAKYYNSLAGFQKWSGTWESDGYYIGWDCGWIYCDPVERHTRQYDYPHTPAGSDVPFWMMANAGNAGIGSRDDEVVSRPETWTPALGRDGKVGVPPVYQPSLDNDEIVLERETGTFRFDPKIFFGGGVNRFDPDDAYTSRNSGYSGLHSGSPLEAMFNAKLSVHRSTSNLASWAYCREPDTRETPPAPLKDTFFPTKTSYPSYFRPMDVSPRLKDQFLASMLMRKLSAGHPEWLMCPGRDSVHRRVLCEKNYYGRYSPDDSLSLPYKARILVDTTPLGWDSARVRLIKQWDTATEQQADSLDPHFLSATLQTCKDSTLSTVVLNRYLAGVTESDSIPFQVYLDSLAKWTGSQGAWRTGDDIGARVELDRQWVGVMDDAYFDPMPEVWSQKFFLYPPGYRKPKADSLGTLLYGIEARSDVEWQEIGSSYRIPIVNSQMDSIIGRDRLAKPDSSEASTERQKAWQLPGQERWYFKRFDDGLLGSHTQDEYDFADAFKGHGMGAYSGASNTLSLRNNVAYTVAPHINWMHPWFYMHDPKVTVVHQTLYAPDTQSLVDGHRWDETTGGRTIKGLETFGGYKEGQIGYWFRPSPWVWDSTKSDTVRRVFPRNADGEELSEVDLVEGYAMHVRPDSSAPKKFTHHDLSFHPRLVVSDRTRGVVWDTVSVPWPRVDFDFLRPDHLDNSSLADSVYRVAPGRTWGRIDTVLRPDFNWLPDPRDWGKPQGRVAWNLRDALPELPDERWTGLTAGRRPHRLFGNLRSGTVRWGVTPRDSFGLVLDTQDRIIWGLDTSAIQALVWHDVWTNAERSMNVARPTLSASYLLNPDTLVAWNSSKDSLLAATGGWIYLREDLADTLGFTPRRSLALVPPAISTGAATNVPCYRPWESSAFVRLHHGDGLCGDSIGLNPNLLLSGSEAKWDLELFYPDGQTPNRDIAPRAGASLNEVALGLSVDRSSQRWVRLQGRLPDSLLDGGRKLGLKSWSILGQQGAKFVSLELPHAQTDSVDVTRGIHPASLARDPWAVDTTPDLAWWNVTGLWGNARFLVQANYGEGSDAVTQVVDVPFVIGTPSQQHPVTIADAYGRATLDLPADSTGKRPPIVLHTLAGVDLEKLPLRGAVPVGPVIQMSPSGTRFDPVPATLEYRLTLRELLAARGTPVASESLATSLDGAREVLKWAHDELAIWVVSDAGDFEKVPSEAILSGDTTSDRVSLDFTQFILVGTIRHFSFAAVLNRDASKSIAPRWMHASIGDSLHLRLDLRTAERLGGKPTAVEIRLSTATDLDTSRFLPGSLLLPANTSLLDTSLVVPQVWRSAVTPLHAFARYRDGVAWSSTIVDQPGRGVHVSGVEAIPPRVASSCTDSVRIRFRADGAGVVRARVAGPDGSVDWLQSEVDSGVNALVWPVCQGQIPRARGVYRALVEVVGHDGSIVSDSAEHLAVWGVDTTAPSVGPLQGPSSLVLPHEVPVRFAARIQGWSSDAIATLRVRRESDARGQAVSASWIDVPVASVDDSVIGFWILDATARPGAWRAELRIQDGSLEMRRAMSWWTDSAAITASLHADPDTILLGERVRVRIAASDVVAWNVQLKANGTSTTVAQGAATGDFSRSLWINSDSIGQGTFSACLTGSGRLGNVVQRCDSFVVEVPRTRVDFKDPLPQDTLWVGWPLATLREDSTRRDLWTLEGTTSRPDSLALSVEQGGRVLRRDTVRTTRRFQFTWDGRDSSGAYAQAGAVTLRLTLLGGTTQFTWNVLVHRIPRVFVWPGRVSNAVAAEFAATLRAKGITAQVGDATAAARYIDAAPHGTLVLLDSALAPELWRGAASGRLIPWSHAGGNLVFFGAPAFSSYRTGQGVSAATASDRDVTVDLYGLPSSGALRQRLRASFAAGIRQAGIAIDSVDGYAERFWPRNETHLAWSQRLGWFDSAKVEVEAGLVGRIIDTVHLVTRSGRDTFELDTVLHGAKLFFPSQEDGPRAGALMELPTITSGNASLAAELVWADLFVPDLAVVRQDVVVVGQPAKPRKAGKWSPIPGDSLAIAIQVRVRDGGEEILPESLSVKLPAMVGMWPDTILRAALHRGRVQLPVYRARLPDTASYGDLHFPVVVDTLRLVRADTIIREQILRNNLVDGTIRVGDTAKPSIRWVDSVSGLRDGVPARVVPVSPGKRLDVAARTWTRHRQTGWTAWWQLEGTTGRRLEADSATSQDLDSVLWSWDPAVADDAVHGTYLGVRLAVRDTFGNLDTARLKFLIDAIPPVLEAVTVGGLKPELDTNAAGLLFLPPKEVISNGSATIRVSLRDETMLGRVLLIEEGKQDTVVLLDTIGGRQRVVEGRVKVRPDTLFDEHWKLLVTDRAGNDTSVSLRVVRDAGAPKVIAFRVRIPDGSGLLQPTKIDTIPADSARKRLTTWVQLGTSLLTGDPTTYQKGSIWGSNGKDAFSAEVKRNQPLDIVLAPLETGKMDSLWVTFDGRMVDTSFRRDLDDLLQVHPRQRLVRVVPTRSQHRMVFGARDLAGNIDSLVVVLVDSLADLQVVDSADDGVGGPDWGEVYMRRNVWTPPGLGEPETWDYWLVQRRNHRASSGDDRDVDLVVDLDEDSTTGDTSLAPGFRGADVRLRWLAKSSADDGSAIEATKYEWDPSTHSWALIGTMDGEGINSLAGFAIDANQADNPSTETIGEGDQRLPSNTIAKASHGATEIGLRNTARNRSLDRIRWAILPVDGPGDTVRSDSGTMLAFEPSSYKRVDVDGTTPDWWPNNTPIAIEARNATKVHGDTMVVSIGVRNLGTRPVEGFRIKYWFESIEAPRAVLVGTPAGWQSVSMEGPTRETAKGDRQWSVTLRCDSCTLVGGADVYPIGRVLLIGASAASKPQDDWSLSSDSIAPNPKLPVYDGLGRIIAGSEPPARRLLPPIARIAPTGPIWVRLGERLPLDGSGSVDPEGGRLGYDWRLGSTGRSGTAIRDTFPAMRLGTDSIRLRVWDLDDPAREAWTTLAVIVHDGSGGVGNRPIRTDSVYLFDDQWNSPWIGQEWRPLKASVTASDSVRDRDGVWHALSPYRGSHLLSLPFDSAVDYLWMKAVCDSSHWIGKHEYWCHDQVDMAKYTNLEFSVAYDGDLRKPMRLWLTRAQEGQGNGIPHEEDFVYLASYLQNPEQSWGWQKVSIPLKELFTEPERSVLSGWLQIKLMVDDPYSSQSSTVQPRVLMDDIRLVRYETAPGEIVTTRRSALQILANTQQSGGPNSIGMAVRLLNSGSVSLSLDSIRLKTFYHTKEGEFHPSADGLMDTTWGADDFSYHVLPTLPVDSTINRSDLDLAWSDLVPATPARSDANQFAELRWLGPTTAADTGLRLRPTAAVAFWQGIVNVHSRIGGGSFNNTGVRIPRFDGTRSLHWSWPDSADIYQFAPHIVAEHLQPDGTWARLWGRAPEEDPSTVTYWNRENLRDPDDAISAMYVLRAHITWIDSSTVSGAQVTLSGAQSRDPKGHPLGYLWIGAENEILHEGQTYPFTLPRSGTVRLQLRVWDISDPTRTAVDSFSFGITSSGEIIDSMAILDQPNGTWKFGAAWGMESDNLPEPEWLDSIVVPKMDGQCPVALKPARGEKIIRVNFGAPELRGVRFQAARTALDTSRFTHLEFWVASSREWPETPDRERGIRLWLTHQTAPVSGYDNHASEEDFNLLQAYLPQGHLTRRWQKVSIPWDELLQKAPPNSPGTWYLKFARDWATQQDDSARDADLYLSGLRWVRHLPGNRVTTRRVGAAVTGSLFPSSTYNGWRGTLRLHNPTSVDLYANAIRLRFPTKIDRTRMPYLQANVGDQGTDESIDERWFSGVFRDSLWPASVEERGRVADGDVGFVWDLPLTLPAGKAWQGILTIPWVSSYDQANLPWFMPFYNQAVQQMLNHVVVDGRRVDGSWGRLWGLLPGETFASAPFWSPEPLRAPSDTVAAAGSVREFACGDTTTPTPPTDTSGVLVPVGNVGSLPSVGRDPGLSTTAVVVGGKSGVEVHQTVSDWSVKHTFVFDTAWARRREILVDVWVDPAQMTGSAWVGSLALSTFDGHLWLSLDPTSGANLQSAVGTWQTLRFAYDPTRYALDSAFDLQFLANGHGSETSIFRFVLGAIRLGQPTGEVVTPPTPPDPPAPPAPPVVGIGMDSLARWPMCNGCELRAVDGRSAIAVVPAGGGSALEAQVLVDSAFRAGHTFQLEIRSEYVLQGWETVTIILVNEASGQWWDTRTAPLLKAADSTWTQIQLPYNGSLYQLGSQTKFKIALNSNAPNGKRLLLDNLTWVP